MVKGRGHCEQLDAEGVGYMLMEGHGRTESAAHPCPGLQGWGAEVGEGRQCEQLYRQQV
jgi:hypothetical protein